MRDAKKIGVFVAAIMSVAVPNFSMAESMREPSDFAEGPDSAEISVQLDETVSDVSGGDDAGDEDSTDLTDENADASDGNTDVLEDRDLGVVDDDVDEVPDAWVTTTGDDEPIYLEFASGGGPVHRDALPLPAAPDTGPSSPNLVASDRLDATLGVNVHDKGAVAAQCAILHESGEIYQAFYKLYCD